MQTPYYYITEKDLLYDCDLLKNSLQKNWGNYIMGYSVKTNSLPWLLTYLKKYGFYAEVVSGEEYDLAMRLGFEPHKVIYNGPIKDRAVFEKVLLDGGILNMDSSYEPVWLAELAKAHPDKSFEVGIRINCDIRTLSPQEELVEEEGGRFGYCYENGELAKVVKKVEELSNVTLAGIHLHSSTQSRTVEVYRALAAVAVKLGQEFDWKLKYVDMGGGYFGGRSDKPDYRDYFKGICEELRKGYNPDDTILIAEPGVSLISRATQFVSTVLDVKDIREHRYVVTDASRVNLNPQVTRHTYPHHIEYADQEKRDTLPSQWICGATCMEYDRLFEMVDETELKPGDRVIYDTAGGYTICLSPLFIHYFPAVYVEKMDGTQIVARQAWTNDEFLQKNYYEQD